MGIPMIVERSINDVIPIDNAVNESMLNPSILEKEITNEIDEVDEKVLVQEEDETNEDDEIIPDDVSGDDKTILGNGDGTKVENVEKEKDDSGNGILKEKDESNKQTRRSERIKKQRVEIHPDDIGEDDNVNDKDYK